MVVDLATREWTQLKDTSCGKNFEKLKSVQKQAFEIFNLTGKEGYLLVNRSGHISEASPDAGEFCNRQIHIPDVESFTKYSLFIFLGGSLKEEPPKKIFRLVRKFRLDSAHIFYANNPDVVQLVMLKIHESQILNELKSEVVDLDHWINELQNRYFQKREKNVNFRKLAISSLKEQKTALSIAIQFLSSAIKTHSSPAFEMKGLAEALEIEVKKTISQKLNKPNPGSFVGSGKLEEILDAIEEDDYTHLIFNCDLPSRFKRDLDQQSMLTIWDRTDLILEIFKVRARTERAKLHVELASLHYRGEDGIRRQLDDPQFASAMAYDAYKDKLRLKLTEKKKNIKLSLDKLKRQDEERRSNRIINQYTSVALIGYTNAGKSSLFNQFLGREEVATENQLFKTLDTTTRSLEISKQSELLITDTVGFIQQMPQHLREAFHTTLAESKVCSHLLILLDPVGISIQEQKSCITDTLNTIERNDTENWLWIMNKMDLLNEKEIESMQRNFQIDYFISAHDFDSVEGLKSYIIDRISKGRKTVTLELDYSMSDRIYNLRQFATILEEPVYESEWVRIKISYEPDNEYKVEQLFNATMEELTNYD